METTRNVEAIDVEGLYRRYGPMVLRRCKGMLRDEDLAADAMQETFVQVLRHRSSLNARYPSSLLYRIATNTCLNTLRSRRRKYAVSAEPFLDSLAARDKTEDRVLDSWELEQVFIDARESTRQAAMIHYLEEKTLAETAQEVGLSISGVRKRLSSLRRHGEERLAG
ncbi:MAG TPA: sigma-70 family RNA polymerase sigma factor [Spirochaetia bacterium]|nr:sigma-70 family RNA polymerase sigma factor [Spirochaetia bacterium]